MVYKNWNTEKEKKKNKYKYLTNYNVKMFINVEHFH